MKVGHHHYILLQFIIHFHKIAHKPEALWMGCNRPLLPYYWMKTLILCTVPRYSYICLVFGSNKLYG